MNIKTKLFTAVLLCIVVSSAHAAEFACEMGKDGVIIPGCQLILGDPLHASESTGLIIFCNARSESGIESDVRWRVYDPIDASVMNEYFGFEYEYFHGGTQNDWILLESRFPCGNGFIFFRWLFNNKKGLLNYNESSLKKAGLWEWEDAKVTYKMFTIVDIAMAPLLEATPPDWAKEPPGKRSKTNPPN